MIFLCVYFCCFFCFYYPATSATIPIITEISLFSNVKVFYFVYSVEFLGSGRPGLFLIYYISCGIILCRQFNIGINVGHVYEQAFTTIYPIQISPSSVLPK